MKAFPLLLPTALQERIGAEIFLNFLGVGNPALLDKPMLGLISSRECPSHVLLGTLDSVSQWVKEKRVILSGFHSPLEQQVYHSVLRRKGRAVRVLARGFAAYRPPAEEREALKEERLLVLTPFLPEIRRTTRATALERNRLVLALSAEVMVPFIAEDSPLAELIARHDETRSKQLQSG